MQKWEYMKIWREMDFTGFEPMALGPAHGPVYIWKDIYDEKDTTRYTDEMNRLHILGKQGWELVSVLYEEVGRKHTYTYFLKRPLS